MTPAENKTVHVEVRPVKGPRQGVHFEVSGRILRGGWLSKAAFIVLGLIASILAGLFMVVMLVVGLLAGIISLILSPLRKR